MWAQAGPVGARLSMWWLNSHMATTRSDADSRRAQVLDAAVRVFGARGYYGTSTQEVAAEAGISQPYIYRLFPGKEALFVQVVKHVSGRLQAALADGASESRSEDPRDVLAAMTAAYDRLTRERDLLMLLLQANAAAAVPAIREALRECYAEQVEYMRTFGADDAEIREMFGRSLLANVMVAIDADELDAPWARTLTGAPAARPGEAPAPS